MESLELGTWNVWLLSVPFLALGTCMVGMRKDLIKRMSDMSGYTRREKLFTVAASSVPYPFVLLTLWVPLTSMLPLLYLGLVVYVLGMALCAASLKVIISTPPDELFASGPYRFSRNPMYVSATIVFFGICIATYSFILAGYLTISVVLQHFMILAEERTCKEKYGGAFERYLQEAPRYLFIF